MSTATSYMPVLSILIKFKSICRKFYILIYHMNKLKQIVKIYSCEKKRVHDMYRSVESKIQYLSVDKHCYGVPPSLSLQKLIAIRSNRCILTKMTIQWCHYVIGTTWHYLSLSFYVPEIDCH